MALSIFWLLSGFLVQNFLSLEIILGTAESWHYVQLLSVVFSLPEILTFKWIPESIGFLNNQGLHEQVKNITKSIYGTDDIHKLGLDFDQKTCQNQDISTQNVSWKEFWTNKTLLKLTIFVLIYCLLDMSTGVITISFYATEIIRSFEFNTLTSQLFTMLFTLFRIVASLLGSYLTKKIKRKLHVKISIIGILIFNLLLFILGFFSDSGSNAENASTKNLVVKIFELVAINGMSLFFNLGVHVIIGVLPEMAPTQYKMMILRVWSLAINITMLVHVLVFPIVFTKIGHYTFAIYLAVNLIYLVWAQFRYVESKDIPAMEIFRKFENRGYF